MPVPAFCEVFHSLQQLYVEGPLDSYFSFNSEWGDTTSGGNPMLTTWRENPLYLVRNRADEPVQIIGMIRQPDKRSQLHRQTSQELNYIQCGLILVKSIGQERIPTYLVTPNNHITVHKGLFFNSREVANIITVPASSMCYLVPTTMMHGKGKFILSYWILNHDNADALSIERVNVKVARHLPAISHIDLCTGKERVDFKVDVPTDVHILLKQERAFKMDVGGDVIAKDFVALYLYDEDDKRLCGALTAMNYRENALVHHLDFPGRYALLITCPGAKSTVSCKLEIVALEEAHVRITDPPDDANELSEIELSFLDQQPMGVPLTDFPLDRDPIFQEGLEMLQQMCNSMDSDPDAIIEMENHLNERVHELARENIGRQRAKYLLNCNLEKLNPYLDSNPEYMKLETTRYLLTKDPRNSNKLHKIEEELRNLANTISERTVGLDLSFLRPEYEGIPTDFLRLIYDPEFSEMAQKRADLMRDFGLNDLEIVELEESMHTRARQIAFELHHQERYYLDPMPCSIPLHFLPLNEDAKLCELENQLRSLDTRFKRNMNMIAKLKVTISNRVNEIASMTKENERMRFLNQKPLGIPLADLPLDTDQEFHSNELMRLSLCMEDPIKHQNEIKALEKELSRRANELALSLKTELRTCLDPAPYGFPLEALELDSREDYTTLEGRLRVLRRDIKQNANGIHELQRTMKELVDSIAATKAAQDRQFLDHEPEGRLLSSLQLSENLQFMRLDVLCRQLRYNKGNPTEIQEMEDQMNNFVHAIAHQMNVNERPLYLQAAFKNIPLEDLPLDEDPDFISLEIKRQVQKRDPEQNARAISGTEKKLNERAMELAKRKLAADRSFLDPEPQGLPLNLLPFETDEYFSFLEVQRARLKKGGRRNAKAIARIEEELNLRLHQLAQHLKEKERAKFLEPKPNGIPYEDLPLDADQEFCDMEVHRLLLKESSHPDAEEIRELEEALNEHALELAKKKKEEDRAFLDSCPLGLPLKELALDAFQPFLTKEAKLRVLRRNPMDNAAEINVLMDELASMVKQIAAEELEKHRMFLDPDPRGRLLKELPLNTDTVFRDLENEYRNLKKLPRMECQKLADLEELMNERAHELAKMINAAERGNYLHPAPRGIAYESLHLDDDEEFRQLEEQRTRLCRFTAKNKKAIEDIELALNLRAEEVAQEQIEADRGFLDTEPEGIPIKYVPLHEDARFCKLEEERMALKTQGKPANNQLIHQIEDEMNLCAHEIAKALKKKIREDILPEFPGGISRDVLTLDDDTPYSDLEAAFIRARGEGENPERENDLADAMAKRAVDVAFMVREDERAQLDIPFGFSSSELPLDECEEYLAIEAELCTLRANPDSDPQKITAKTNKLKALILELAKKQAAAERQFLDPEPEGRALEELKIDEDPAFCKLEEQYHRAKRNPYCDQEQLSSLEQAMHVRVCELAHQKNAAERTTYLNPRPRNIPLMELPLDTDEIFIKLEGQRAKLCREPNWNVPAIKIIEETLNERAIKLAEEAIKNDRIFLKDESEGVPLRQIPFEQDKEFLELEEKRMALKNDPKANRATIRGLEDQLNERVCVLAREVKQKYRKYFNQNALGIPIDHLISRIDEDEQLNDLEEKYRDAMQDSTKEKVAAQLLDQINDRIREISQNVHETERALLIQDSDGIPLSALPLNEDITFLKLENTIREIAKERPRDPRLEELRMQLDDHAKKLAIESRKQYCNPSPGGLPLELLKLGEDRDFLALEAQLRRLKQNPVANRQKITELVEELNGKACAKAKGMLEGDRGYLNDKPEGIPLENIPIDKDEKFHQMEVERMQLKSEGEFCNVKAIVDLEIKLNERIHELAKEMKESEISTLAKDPMGIPHNIIKPHDDPEFAAMVEQLRVLKLQPQTNATAIKELKECMNARVTLLAMNMLQDERARLKLNPEGVPLEILPLTQDLKFHKLELERIKLKSLDPVRNAKRIEELEAQLVERVHELAEDQKREDLSGVDPNPEGIPLTILDPYSDPTFCSYLPTLRTLKSKPLANKAPIGELQAKMYKRCQELANDRLTSERLTYLLPSPKGVPLKLLSLTHDAPFHGLEAQRYVLKAQNPRRNADRLRELEHRLNRRAEELAEQLRRKELEGLEEATEGIPPAALKPHDDPAFSALVRRLRELTPRAPSEELVALRREMAGRLRELARAAVQGSRGYLDPEPQGVPLRFLPLDTDPVFHELECERLKLRATGVHPEARAVKELEAQLNNRAHELALAQHAEDLRHLTADLHDLPPEVLRLHEDPVFKGLADELRAVREGPSPQDSALMTEVVSKMNCRARELADAAMGRDYLDQNPEGVPLEILPLDTDPLFHDIELEHAKLKLKKLQRNDQKLKDLEDQLNDRAHELAALQLAEDLSGIDQAPEGIPLELLRPASDPEIAAMIPYLRELKRDPETNASSIRELEDLMNNRAYQLADQLLDGDRDYLDPEPAGVPLGYLPLTEDIDFSTKEVERAKLKAKDPIRNARYIQELEVALNERVRQLADRKIKAELALFEPQYDGIDTASLRPHQDPIFSQLINQMRVLESEGKSNEAKKLLPDLDARLVELTREQKEGDLWFLKKEVEGLSIEDVPFDSDVEFIKLRKKRAELKTSDPRHSVQQIRDLEDQMNSRVCELARGILDHDFDGVNSNPYDVPLEMLNPREDPKIARILPELRRAKRSAWSSKAAAELQKKLVDRVDELARIALQGDRLIYLDSHSGGVMPEYLPLDTDPIYHGLEVERARLKLSHPGGNVAQIEDLEERLKQRAQELAKEVIAEDLKNLDQTPRGIPIEYIKPHDNVEFIQLALWARELRRDPHYSKSKLKEVEEKMNDLIIEMADQAMKNSRSFLDPTPAVVSIDILPLSEDPVFHNLEVQRAVLKTENAAENAGKIGKLEEKLNERLHELIEEQKRKDLCMINKCPNGVPAELLHPHDNEEFASLLIELRRLKKNYSHRSSLRLENVQTTLNSLLNNLATDYLAEDRARYLSPDPQGIPLNLLSLDRDAKFKSLENERLNLINNDPIGNKDAILELEKSLNARINEFVKELLRSERVHLVQNPMGVPLSALPLDTDRVFADLESQRLTLKLKNPIKNSAEIYELELQLNDRAVQRALSQMEDELRFMEDNVEDLPVAILKPYNDSDFVRIMNTLRELKQGDPEAYPQRIKTLEDALKNRIHELADVALRGDRRIYLDSSPKGVDLNAIPLDSDKSYHQMEVERAMLKLKGSHQDQAKIADLQGRLNERAHELANKILENDLVGLQDMPFGVPVKILNPHNDDFFNTLALQRRSLPKDASSSDNSHIVNLLNERLVELAKELLVGDRASFLESNPCGTPLFLLPLDTDPEFHSLEVERAKLKAEGPKLHSVQLSNLEHSLRKRACELAKESLLSHRDYLVPFQCNVEISELPLDADVQFHKMEVERAKLKAQDPEKNAEQIASLENRLNDRVHELALKQLHEDLEGLDPISHGIPIESLDLHSNPEFSTYVSELRRLKLNPSLNAPKIKDLHAKMNACVDGLTRQKIDEVRQFLGTHQEGVALTQLPLDSDTVFTNLEQKLLLLLYSPPPQDDEKIAHLKDQMLNRVRELAREKIQGDRGYLDPEVDGVPIIFVPIDTDERFRKLEATCAKLRENPVENADAISNVEDQLRKRVRELVIEGKNADRAFLNETSHGIPKKYLPFEIDIAFKKMEHQLRRLKQNPRRNAAAIEKLQCLMQDRADELGEMKLKGKRDQYLDPTPEGLPISELPLDSDPAYHKMEVKLALRRADGVLDDADEISALEMALNKRAHELAREQITRDRAFLDRAPECVSIEDIPLDSDLNFLRMEDYLRILKKDPRHNGAAIKETQEKMQHWLHELAKGIILNDLACLPETKYRGIPRELLNLHANAKFSSLANERRAALREGKELDKVQSVEKEMHAIALEVANDQISAERAFLDKFLEGMSVNDLPLDEDKEFVSLETERRRYATNQQFAKHKENIIQDLEERMIDRANYLVKEEFAKMRETMEQEPEGLPLSRIPLDFDPEFKEAEIARFNLKKQPNPDLKKLAKLEKRMNDRAHELARKELAKDQSFLNPAPLGVSLLCLPLRSDFRFNELAKQRQALKNTDQRNPEALRKLEDQMNDRAHELAQEYLNCNREYLDPNPQNVPLADLPLNRDPIFREMENELLRMKKDAVTNPDAIFQQQDDLRRRTDELARELLRKERAMQDQAPLGVPLEELPLNYDPILNALERKRRDLNRDPRPNTEVLSRLRDEIERRVLEIAKEFLSKERTFLDQNPSGIPLSCLPLNTDRDFQEMGKELRGLKKQPVKNKVAIEDLMERMHDRVNLLAQEQLDRDRKFLDPEPLGVPLSNLPLNRDSIFKSLESQRRVLVKDAYVDAKTISNLEKQLNDRAHELARVLLDEERAFLPQDPQGVPLRELPLDNDKAFREMEQKLRKVKKDPGKKISVIDELKRDMIKRVEMLAKRYIMDGLVYLNPEPLGVPLADLNLSNDPEFCRLEQAYVKVKRDPKEKGLADKLVHELNEVAKRVAANFLKQERSYLYQKPEGIPLETLPLNDDVEFRAMEVDRRRLKKDPSKNANAIRKLEERMNKRIVELAKIKKGYQDPEFHASNNSVAEKWTHICDLYPDGAREAIVPEKTLPSDVCSAPGDASFLAPLIAALARHTVLISRLFLDKYHPKNQPYRITLFNPDGSLTVVEIDGRVACNRKGEPKFLQTPPRICYPLLLEKAYAKFLGGYPKFSTCNVHDTLRDLVGRPVMNISLEDPKLTAETYAGSYATLSFWLRVAKDLVDGDVFVAMANHAVPNGFRALCSYPLLDVILKGGNDDGALELSDVVVKLYSCYFDKLTPSDANDGASGEANVMLVPVPVFLANFTCLQRCRINCGNRLSAPGEWTAETSGGAPRYTTFHRNPIYLVENKSLKPSKIIVEVRHVEPLEGSGADSPRYPFSGVSLMQPIDAKLPPTPFITDGTHRMLQKGVMLNSREVCVEMELPASSVGYLIPFTKDRGTTGRFKLSIYPGFSNVTLTPLRHAGLTFSPLHCQLTVPEDEEGTRVDFLLSSACDVHILMHQTKVTDPKSIQRGDTIGESELMMIVFNEYGIKVGTTRGPSNAREQLIVFKAPQGGRYSLVMYCSGSTTEGPCTVNVDIYTSKDVQSKLVPVPPDARRLSLHGNRRFPCCRRSLTSSNISRNASRDRRLSKISGGSTHNNYQTETSRSPNNSHHYSQ
ncbi:unnamed protein product [Phytomonas sp. EM1]|nr:unnamed protein product [Phytomonas sp. EM1]|eukprot:CCW61011.1 unnamed protein product [Phytomonas sp. isolate EM1]